MELAEIGYQVKGGVVCWTIWSETLHRKEAQHWSDMKAALKDLLTSATFVKQLRVLHVVNVRRATNLL